MVTTSTRRRFLAISGTTAAALATGPGRLLALAASGPTGQWVPGGRTLGTGEKLIDAAVLDGELAALMSRDGQGWVEWAGQHLPSLPADFEPGLLVTHDGGFVVGGHVRRLLAPETFEIGNPTLDFAASGIPEMMGDPQISMLAHGGVGRHVASCIEPVFIRFSPTTGSWGTPAALDRAGTPVAAHDAGETLSIILTDLIDAQMADSVRGLSAGTAELDDWQPLDLPALGLGHSTARSLGAGAGGTTLALLQPHSNAVVDLQGATVTGTTVLPAFERPIAAVRTHSRRSVLIQTPDGRVELDLETGRRIAVGPTTHRSVADGVVLTTEEA